MSDDSNSRFLTFTMQRLVELCPRIPGQLVASCSHPDLWIAIASLTTVTALLPFPLMRQHMLDAGVAGGIVRALSYPCPDCRKIACLFAGMGNGDPELLQQLVDAGVVPALMEVLREGRSPEPEDPDDRTDGPFAEDFSYKRGETELDLSGTQPALQACLALGRLMTERPSIAREVVLRSWPMHDYL